MPVDHQQVWHLVKVFRIEQSSSSCKCEIPVSWIGPNVRLGAGIADAIIRVPTVCDPNEGSLPNASRPSAMMPDEPMISVRPR
jgi:hypothetical protein